ncbi:MAG: hypothetical protein C0596_10515 [Marinilabiliales bacterium]|nr:MAG: hypothetical protein C0596_10515 [Marinilabiliales bacterium]
MADKKFDPKKKSKLNNPQRLKLIPIDIIVNSLDLTEPKNLVDYGAGTGFFTDYLSEQFPKARVFALDIEEQMIEEINQTLDVPNIFPIQIEDNQMPFAENDIDAVWSIAVYHELKTPDKWLRNVHRTLKPGGKLLIIDWSVNQKPDSKMGPPLGHRIREEKVINDLQNTGFKNSQIISGFKNHFGIIAIK